MAKSLLDKPGLQYTLTKIKDYIANKDIRTATPVGGSIIWYGSEDTIPSDYMREDGRSLNKNEYSELFAIIGYTYGGSGDNFNIPDSRGKVLVHLNETDEEFNTLGKQFGEKAHKLTINEIPSHKHQYGEGDGNVVHGGGTGSNASISLAGDQWRYTNRPYTYTTGGDQAHNNIQPSLVAYRIIKVKSDVYTRDLKNLDDLVTNLTNQINTYAKRAVLWENPNQNYNQTFEPQIITLESDDYDELEFIFLSDVGEPLTFTQKCVKGMGVQAQFMSNAVPRWWSRRLKRISDIEFDVIEARLIMADGTVQTDNTYLIPLKIIGIKNSI